MVRCPTAFSSMARQNGYVLAHRLAMAKALGRPLTKAETVHHRNGDKLDNWRKNLELFPTHAAHWKTHHAEHARRAEAFSDSKGMAHA